MKKLLSAAIALMLTASLCLTSCGDDGSSSGAGDASSAGSTVSAAESEPSGVSEAGNTGESSAAAVPADTSVTESVSDASSAPAAESTPAENSSESSTPAPSGSLAGKWELEEISSDEFTAKGEVDGHPVAILFQFEFKEDGTAEMMQSEYGSDIKRFTMNWKEKEGGLALLNPTGDEVSVFTLEDGRLVGKLGKATLKLVKVNEFTTYELSGEPEDDSTPAESLTAEQVVGIWEMAELRVGNTTINDPAKTVGTMQFNFREDGTGITYRTEDGESESDSVKWSLSDNTLTVEEVEDDPDEADSDIIVFQLKNGMLECTDFENGQKMVIRLKKASGS